MTTKQKTMRVVLVVPILICMLLTIGCSSTSKEVRHNRKVDAKIKPTLEEKEKARLLKKIDRDFDNANAHYKLGKLYQTDGLWAESESQFNLALSFDPIHIRAQAAKIKVLINSGSETTPELLADIYIEQASNSASASLSLALAFQNELLDDYALRCYHQSLRLAPNSAKINRQIGYYYLSKNDESTAKGYLTRSFQLNNNQPEVAGELGRLGVAIKIPRKKEKNMRKLDRLVEEAENN